MIFKVSLAFTRVILSRAKKHTQTHIKFFPYLYLEASLVPETLAVVMEMVPPWTGPPFALQVADRWLAKV
jgi:hypothetical protein